MAVVGGAKVSTKIELLENLVKRVDMLVIGGAMANTFLAAQGFDVGKSLYEPDQIETARKIIHMATETGAAILLPVDVVVAKEFKAHAAHRTVPVAEVARRRNDPGCRPGHHRRLRAPPATRRDPGLERSVRRLRDAAFRPGTVAAAKAVAQATKAGKLLSVAGGGDTVAALNHAGVADDFSYVSTAGGAFLEWLEGQELPGVEALQGQTRRK